MRKFIIAALAILFAGPAFAQSAEPWKDGRAIQQAAMTAKVGSCTTNLFQREGFSGGQKVKVVPLYDTNPHLALACANTSGGADKGTHPNSGL